jgi:NAD-dependent dihydropyrimidine dehydrogenase PreA subunit
VSLWFVEKNCSLTDAKKLMDLLNLSLETYKIMALINQRVDVPVIVDESKCLEKCVACIEVCPLDVLAKNPETGKAYMKYDECWFCLPCEKECPTNAITVQIPFLLR